MRLSTFFFIIFPPTASIHAQNYIMHGDGVPVKRMDCALHLTFKWRADGPIVRTLSPNSSSLGREAYHLVDDLQSDLYY
jgi:hypothetical protein